MWMPVPRVLLPMPLDGLKTWDTIILHAMDAFKINVVLVVGHDRLYSMLGTMLKKRAKARLESHDTRWQIHVIFTARALSLILFHSFITNKQRQG
jgi:hypothetical protein